MSFVVARWRPAPLAPRTTGWGLWIAVLVLTLIGAGASIVGVAGLRWAMARRAADVGSITVAALPHGLETADAAAARTQDVLRRRPGVAGVAVQDAAPDDALIAALMGAAGSGDAAPRFVTVRLAPGAKVAASDLAATLAAQGIAARYDDHRGWIAPVERAVIVAAVFVAVSLVLGLAAIAGLAWRAAGVGVRRVRMRMLLMRDLGAAPAFLAAQFPGPIGVSSAIGGTIGAALAAGAVFWAPDRVWPTLWAALKLDGLDVLAAAPWPPIAFLIGGLFARLGAGGALRKLTP